MPTVNKIPVATYRKALTTMGLKHIRTKGGHEMWSREDLGRDVVFSAHFKEVPGMQVRSNCRTLNIQVEIFMKLVNTL